MSKFKLVSECIVNNQTVTKEIFIEDVRCIDNGSCECATMTLHDDTIIDFTHLDCKQYG